MMNSYGASQFAGGGFMPSPGGNATGYGGGGGGENRRSGIPQTLRAVTIRQVLEQNATVEDDQFKVDGLDLTTVTVVGRLINVQEQGHKLLYTVDDGTACMDVIFWTSDDGLGKPQINLGGYVRAYGNLRTFNRVISLNAYTLKPVTDHNEVTYHFLQAIFQRLHLAKMGTGVEGGAGGAQPDISPMGMGTYRGGYAGAGAGGGQGGAYQAVGQQQQGGWAPPAVGGSNPLQDAILEIYISPEVNGRDTGMGVDEMIDVLRNRGAPWTPAQILAAIDHCSNEGLLYSTVDGFYKSTAGA